MADWQGMRAEYTTGDLSYRELAEKHAVSVRQVARIAGRDGWVAARKVWRQEAAAGTEAEAAEAAAEASALVYQVARLVLERFLEGLQKAGGVRLRPADAARWASILLALDDAGGGEVVRDLRELTDAELETMVRG